MRWLKGLLKVGVLAGLLALPAPPSGFWRRTYLAHLPMPSPAAWNAPATPPPSDPADPLPDAPEGIGAYLSTAIPDAELPRAFRGLESLELSWARTEIPWSAVEPEPGKWEWERWDRVVEGLRHRRYRVLGLLCYWNQHHGPPYSDRALAGFGRYCEQVVRRYRGQVSVWEVWNEPNEQTFWTGTPERYAELLRLAHAAVKRADPQATVLGCSTAGVDLPFVQRVLKASGGSMDALSVHPYSFGWRPEDAELLEELQGASALMAAAGKSPRVWVTEIGYPRSPNEQRDWTERATVLMRQSQAVEAWCWFCLQQSRDEGYGLYGPDWSPRLVLGVVKGRAGELRGWAALGSALPADLSAPWGAGTPYARSALQAWRFRKGQTEKQVFWSPAAPVDASAVGVGRLSTRPVWREQP